MTARPYARTAEERKNNKLQDELTNPTHLEKIAALVPIADARAKKRVSILGRRAESREGKGETRYQFDFFTQFFHQEMNKLAAEEGLRTI